MKTDIMPMVTITPFHVDSIGPALQRISATDFWALAAGVWPSQNLALFFPFFVARPMSVVKGFWFNGATVANNVDLGVYSEDGVLLGSTGSVVQATVSALQSAAMTAGLAIGPGVFYLALVSDSTTATFFRATPTALNLIPSGAAQVADAVPLSATVTLASMAQAYVPVFGISLRSLV